MTLSLQHPTLGKKGLIIRGVRMAGVDKGIAQMRLTHPTLGDKVIWDGSLASLTVSLDNPDVSGAVASAVPRVVTTGPCTATATGGSPPYAYACAHVSDDGDGGTWSALSPASATTAFQASSVASEITSLATFRFTATDARGATGTADVTALAHNFPV